MPRTVNVSVENNFSKGLITEATGLNFPENAATDTDNCVFDRLGSVTRRLGIDYEANHTDVALNLFTGNAISYFKWDNAGGDGNTKILVQQVGGALYFWRSSTATTSLPLSQQRLASVISLADFVPSGGALGSAECQYASGNGYLFVFNANLEPFYCTYNAGTVTALSINIQVRDFTGLPEPGVPDDLRISPNTKKHVYNLQNQGWLAGPGWTSTSSTSNNTILGSKNFTIQTGITAAGAGDIVNMTAVVDLGGGGNDTYTAILSGTVTAYTSGTGALTVNVTSSSFQTAIASTQWTFSSPGFSYIDAFAGVSGSFPANSDVWWRFKDSTSVFNPSVTLNTVTLDQAHAPQGKFILSLFNQDRGSKYTLSELLTIVSTTARPKTGTWFQGRVWYAGTDAAFPAQGDAGDFNWTESIYFSQIIERPEQFERCYQVNDPTSEDKFDLLPSDGGVIRIQGCGTVFKLYPIQNGMLVFAANGIWFITGSQGIGFTANDYTVTKISAVQSISSTSFVDVQGYPTWWNEEGIYSVLPGQQGLQVNSATFPTISTFYEDIPLTSKKYARGDYNPLDYTIQWVYRETEESDITSRYQFNRVLNFNVGSTSFYPWTIATSSLTPHINGVVYIAGPGGSTSPPPTFKYITSYNLNGVEIFTFSEERDTTYLDWETPTVGQNYESFFVTGFKPHGQAQKKFQPTYVYMFSNNEEDTAYRIQGIWNYANSGNSGRFSVSQLVENSRDNFDKLYRRHKIRGSGVILQFKVLSVEGEPFDIMGWSVFETINAGV